MKTELSTIEKAVKGQIEKHIKDQQRPSKSDENSDWIVQELEEKLLTLKKTH